MIQRSAKKQMTLKFSAVPKPLKS